MKKNLPFIIVGVFIIALITITILSKRTSLNEDGTIGNSAGNLNNKGLFCEHNGKVYFSNPYDNDLLYSMNLDETNAKKITNIAVSYINCDGRKIYYSQRHHTNGTGLGFIRKATGLFSCDLKGNKTVCYTQDAVGITSLCGSNLYYQHYTNKTGTYLDKIRIDKKNPKTVFTEMITPSCVVGNIIYYAGVDKDHYLYALDTSTDLASLVWEHNVYNPVYENGYIYFMDIDTGYELHRYDLTTGKEQTLTTDRLDYFNVYGNIIYYQKSSSTQPALKRIAIDGTGEEIVKEGVFEQVNITSNYVYFNEFNKPTPVYHQPTLGSIQVSVFQP